MTPLVSICIPSYSHPDLLERCLQSVLEQEYENIEVIISDDTPGESVKIIVDRYCAQMSVSYYHNDPSLGTPANWNNALDKGKGELLMLLHHDDWLAHKHSISRCVELFNNNPHASVLFGRSMAIDKLLKNDSEKFDAGYFRQFYQKPFKLLLNNVIGPPSNVMMRKEVDKRYNGLYKWLVDLEFYIQLLLGGHQFIYLDERLVGVGLHEGQMSNYVQQNTGILVKENVLFAREYLPYIKNDVKIYDHLWRLLRNQNIRSKADLLQLGLTEDQLPLLITKIIDVQSRISPSVLKNGFVSKTLMLLSYFNRNAT